MQALRNQSRLTYLIWGGLALEVVAALITGRWTAAFVALGTLSLSMTPLFLASRLHIRLPRSIVAVAAVMFTPWSTHIVSQGVVWLPEDFQPGDEVIQLVGGSYFHINPQLPRLHLLLVQVPLEINGKPTTNQMPGLNQVSPGQLALRAWVHT